MPLLRKGENCPVPDILANAGGVVVSYFGMGPGPSENFFWTEQEVNQKLRDILVRALPRQCLA